MSIIIRKMASEEFEIFYKWSIEHQAKELMEECHMALEEAIKETKAEVAGMLPHGLNTADNHLMTIAEADSNEMVGFIWTIHEETNGIKQSFLCDFAIWESKRRRGYAAAALQLAQENAARAGCRESVLFVSDRNRAATALYQKFGYQFLRQEGYGKYMVKKLEVNKKTGL